MNELDVVVDVRQSPDTAELIVSKRKVAFSGQARFVGAPVETRVGLLTRKVEISISGFAKHGVGHVLEAKVNNVGTVPFSIDRVAFEYRYEQPQDFRLNLKGIVGKEISGSVPLSPKNKANAGPLQPGDRCEYFLPSNMFDDVALIAMSLSTDRYWIAAYHGTEELGSIGGEYVRPYLDRSGILIHRRALPPFDTLPESDRLAVIKAVAPLRAVERDRWPAAGAQPLEGIPHAFVMRAGEDLVVVVVQTENKGIEILDIVRRAVLNQFKGPREDAKL